MLVTLAEKLRPEKARDRACRQRPADDLSKAIAARDRQSAPGDRRACEKFIAMSPFCVLATSGSDGSVDASPRGGNPGFVHVAGPNRLLMPDRSGNNRIDSFRNIVEGSGFVQLIFFVPGIDETLRVGGRGKLSAGPELRATKEDFCKL